MAEATELWTLKRLLDWTKEFFDAAGSDSARLDAEILLAEALQCQRIQLYTRFEEVPPAETLTEYRAWVKRRAAGEPVAYIVGHKEFYSLKFNVTPSVLIPRPETEHIVVAAIEAAQSIKEDFSPANPQSDGPQSVDSQSPDSSGEGSPSPIRIIDVGTGSGCVAITLAKHIESSVVAATDVSPDALEVARTNAVHHEVTDRVRFFTGDLLAALPAGSRPVHLIVSNPPYIGRSEIDTVEETVLKYEPELALFGGEQGPELIQRLVDQSVDLLLPGGRLIFENSPAVFDQCLEIIEKSPLDLLETIKDFAGHRRVIVAGKPF